MSDGCDGIYFEIDSWLAYGVERVFVISFGVFSSVFGTVNPESSNWDGLLDSGCNLPKRLDFLIALK
jgi:hypothetical protein